MSYDTLALTMQMQCPLEALCLLDAGKPDYRHRLDADGITGSDWQAGEIVAVCGTEVVPLLADDCDEVSDPDMQWGRPWDPDDRSDRGVDEPGRWPCQRCVDAS